MSPTDWTIAGGALAAIGLVNWYFLGRRAVVAAAPAEGGVEEITIRVDGGYTPSHVAVARGSRVRLIFDRREDNPCSDTVVIPDFSIRRDLPAFRSTSVEFTADKPGRHEFRCGMGMLHGAIEVKE